MVWSIEDFEREISRQLVEMASIRRHAGDQQAIIERLNRLEDSQLFLLRKLRESLRNRKGSGGARRSGPDEEEMGSPEAFLQELLHELKEMTRQSYRLRHLHGQDEAVSPEMGCESELGFNPEVGSHRETRRG